MVVYHTRRALQEQYISIGSMCDQSQLYSAVCQECAVSSALTASPRVIECILYVSIVCVILIFACYALGTDVPLFLGKTRPEFHAP